VAWLSIKVSDTVWHSGGGIRSMGLSRDDKEVTRLDLWNMSMDNTCVERQIRSIGYVTRQHCNGAVGLDLWDLSPDDIGSIRYVTGQHCNGAAGLDLWDLSLDDTEATRLVGVIGLLDNTGAQRHDWIYGICDLSPGKTGAERRGWIYEGGRVGSVVTRTH
jgi:hypothetical protein